MNYKHTEQVIQVEDESYQNLYSIPVNISIHDEGINHQNLYASNTSRLITSTGVTIHAADQRSHSPPMHSSSDSDIEEFVPNSVHDESGEMIDADTHNSVVLGTQQNIVVGRCQLTQLNYNPFVRVMQHNNNNNATTSHHVMPNSDNGADALVRNIETTEQINESVGEVLSNAPANISERTQIVRNFAGVRSMLSDRNIVCHFCGTIIWMEEKLVNSSNINPKFGLCCLSGKVSLPSIPPSPDYLNEMYNDRTFMKDIRFYNTMFSFTSMGAQIDHSVVDGAGPYCFRISGQNYHRIGSLLPQDGQSRKFVQLNVCNTENEIRSRLNFLHNDPTKSTISPGIVRSLQLMLDNLNPYVQIFCKVRDAFTNEEAAELQVRILYSRGSRQYIQPTASEIAAVIVREDTDTTQV